MIRKRCTRRDYEQEPERPSEGAMLILPLAVCNVAPESPGPRFDANGQQGRRAAVSGWSTHREHA